jgi:hypothetical protein
LGLVHFTKTSFASSDSDIQQLHKKKKLGFFSTPFGPPQNT